MGNCMTFKESTNQSVFQESKRISINGENFDIDQQKNPDFIAHSLKQRPENKFSYSVPDSPSKKAEYFKIDNERRDGKRKNKIVANDQDEILENVQKIQKEKSTADLLFIINCLKTNFIFYGLDDSELMKIVEKMFYCKTKSNEFVFQQGSEASSYFIIEQGQIEVIINNEPKKILERGGAFGELALLYNAPRSASTKALQESFFWAIDRNAFRNANEEMAKKQFDENMKFMENVKFFKLLNEQQKSLIVGVLSNQKYRESDMIVNEGDQADSFYVIKEGEVSILKENKELRKMKKGDSFGELALYYNTVRSCSVKALSEQVICLALGREIVAQVLGSQLQNLTYKSQIKWAFENDDLLKQLTNLQMEKISESLKFESYKKNSVILQNSQIVIKLYIFVDGNAQFKNGSIFEKGRIFGVEYLADPRKEPPQDDIIMKEEGIVASISFDSLFVILGGDWNHVIKRNERSHEKTLVRKKQENAAKNLEKSEKYNLNDLIKIKKLGYGQFGSVFSVTSRSNQNENEVFALKCISKLRVVEEKLERHLIQEKQVLNMVDFPFIMKFIRSYKDSYNIYFLTECIQGIELFDAIRDIGLLKQSETKFYTAQIILCIEYLHNQQIIYRDLKPENIMTDSQGYLKLIDMGTAKVLSKRNGNKTFTIIGTPHYMAPEVLSGKGYSFSVDYWTIGIMIYEFLCGGFPFANDLDDPFQICEEINRSNLKFPSFMTDKSCRKLVSQLLSKLPEMRLGGSFHTLKNHAYFDKFNWDKLFYKEMEPPYVPPPNKLISKQEIQKLASKNQLIVDDIKNEMSGKNLIPKKPSKYPNWEDCF